MGLPTKNLQTVAPLLGVTLLGWIVELFSLYYLQKSCHLHNTPAWAAGAGFPALGKCWKLYRFEWLTIWFEFIVVFLIIFTLTSEFAPWSVSGMHCYPSTLKCVLSLLTVAIFGSST